MTPDNATKRVEEKGTIAVKNSTLNPKRDYGESSDKNVAVKNYSEFLEATAEV